MSKINKSGAKASALTKDAESICFNEKRDNELIRPAWIEIDLSALRHNIAIIKAIIGEKSKMMAVVKADAYGHGAVKVAETASEAGADFLGVALLEEAEEIRSAGVKTPIALLYPENIPRSVEAVKRGFYLTVSDTGTLYEITKRSGNYSQPVRYFIKINTGMNRYGFKYKNEIDFSEIIRKKNGLKFMGFTTNLADSNGGATKLSERQENAFLKIMDNAKEQLNGAVYLSYESSGIVAKKKYTDGTLIRVGHLLYGLTPTGAGEDKFRPVMSVKGRIAEIQEIEKGEGIGYGFSFIAERKMKLAVIPMGYADGYSWALSNKGQVLIKGAMAPVVGRVCMDAFIVDITDIAGCALGGDVIIMGAMGEKTINAHMLGKWAGSFSYEILSGWSRRLQRIYV